MVLKNYAGLQMKGYVSLGVFFLCVFFFSEAMESELF